MRIADQLTDLQRAQLISCRPDVFQLGACPHCGGNLFPDNDGYEDYLKCLQCGRNSNSDNPLPYIHGNKITFRR